MPNRLLKIIKTYIICTCVSPMYPYPTFLKFFCIAVSVPGHIHILYHYLCFINHLFLLTIDSRDNKNPTDGILFMNLLGYSSSLCTFSKQGQGRVLNSYSKTIDDISFN